jgi:trimethylamine--corrinoid protein Co-methyltransferase
MAYRHLRHPFEPHRVFSDDGVANIHNMALRVLSELGMKILLPEAREIYRAAGALVNNADMMVRIGPELVEAALATAPKSVPLRAINPDRENRFEPGAMLFTAGAGCPNVFDNTRGRRSGSLETYEETIKFQQAFDVIHMHGPSVEPQNVPANLRHYAMMQTQMQYGDKPMFVYARGRDQVHECFEMIKLGLGLSENDFRNGSWCHTVINTNSPRVIDVPMAEGVIDFARAGQLSIITPFCLAGAMAPVTISGALVLQHAEALAAITLAQMTRAGAPVAYGGFSSNVDMKSGSPAFGTPEHIKLSIGSGQLARFIGLPWRSAAGSASNVADMQGASENTFGLMAAMQANATLTIHSAGWLEGGLTFGYEKFINDIEAVQTIAELAAPVPEDEDSLAWSALSDVEPSGHFFATKHTMDRYKDAFYEPLNADLRNNGAWVKSGAKTATERAGEVWRGVLRDFVAPQHGTAAVDRLAPFIAKRTARGGAAPAGG